MAEFHWKGRTASGQDVTGNLTAASKEAVMAGLRRQGIVVQSIEESDGRGGEEIQKGGPEPLAVEAPPLGSPERLVRQRAQGPHRLRGLLIATAFIAIGFALGLTAPVLNCRCDHPPQGVTTCTLSESDLGVLPLRVQTLADVRSVEIETLSPGGSDRGRTVTVPHVRFVLYSGDRASIHAARWGEDALQPMRTDLISWLLENEPGTFTRRSTEWGTLSLALIPMGIGLLMVQLFLLSLSRRVTDGVYAAAGTLAASADRRRRADPRD
jgi:hypothetical protein